VARNFATSSPYKPTNAMSIRSVVGNVPRRRPGEQKGKELMNRVCINENISITDFVFKQIFFSLLRTAMTFDTGERR
jgi:hypothetical protein